MKKLKILFILFALLPMLTFSQEMTKTNELLRGYYFDMVALDSAYYKISQNYVVKTQMAQHYNSLAWYSLLTNKLIDVEYYINQSIKYDPGLKNPYVNLPHLLLFSKHFEQAKTLYLKYKDQPFDKVYPTYKDVFLIDFKEFEKAGLMNDDIREIIRLLNR